MHENSTNMAPLLRFLMCAGLGLALLTSATQANVREFCAGNTVFTSIKTGSWTDPRIWSGGTGSDYPECAGDTAVISPSHVVTLPIGVSATVAVRNRGTLIIDGTLYLSGNLALGPGTSSLQMGPGSTLDLVGHDVTYSGRAKLQFSGTSDDHVRVTSSRDGGAFKPANHNTTSTWKYVDVSNLADSMFGYGAGNANSFQAHQWVTFTNCAKTELEAGAKGANSGILLSHVDFRNPNTTSATAYEPYIDLGSTALGSQQRTLEYVTWAQTAPTASNQGHMFIRGLGITINNSVLVDWIWQLLSSGTIVKNTFMAWHASMTGISVSGSVPQQLTNNYFYLGANITHPFSPSGVAPLSVSGSVFENEAATCGNVPGDKWFLYGSGVTANISIHNNIFIGSGTIIDFASSAADMNPTLKLYNNTIYENQQGTLETSASATLMRIDHAGGQIVAGNMVELYNNLGANPYQCFGSENVQNVLISIQTAGNDQVSLVGWNTDWAEPSGRAYSPPTIYQQCRTISCTATEDIAPTTDDRSHDFSANPNFKNASASIADWDASLGGPGTEADATAQLLKLNGYGGSFNSSFTQAELLAYVREGFTPQNHSAFRGTGRGGADIGAMAVP